MGSPQMWHADPWARRRVRARSRVALLLRTIGGASRTRYHPRMGLLDWARRRPVPSAEVSAHDLRELESTRVRVKGTAAYVPGHLREHVGGTEYLLRREPDNPYDTNAIAVYWEGQKVGHVSAVKAAAMAPLLDVLGDTDYLVSGMGAYTRSTRLWVDLPKLPALRAYVRGR